MSNAVMDADFPGWHALGISVVVQAFADLRDPDPLKALDALLWLLDDSPLWLDGLGWDVDTVKLLTSGKVTKVKRERKQRA
jgi:hypothetical protein